VNTFKRYTTNVIKTDAEHGVVFGWAIVSTIDGEKYFDLQGDHITESAIVKATLEFSEAGADGKVMHVGDVVAGVPFLFPLTADIAKALGITCSKTGLLIGFKPSNAADLEKFRDGTYSGFSIGGARGEDEDVTDV